MTTACKFIPEISVGETNWTTKVIVARKQSPKNSRNSSGRYQNLLLVDLKENKITSIIYDTNITALEDQLQLGKTYLLSNATVKHNRSTFTGSDEEKVWIITGKTRIEQVNDKNLDFLFSTYEITPFDKLERYMDKNISISVIGVAIDIRQKRIIQTHFGTQACLQDVILIDRNFKTVMLTLWDSFVERECVAIMENLAKKPVLWATELKVSSFNGITLSSKVNSTIFINPEMMATADYREWIKTNKELLDNITEKPFLAATAPKLSPPSDNKFTSLADLLGIYLGNKFYWVKAQWRIVSMQQKFWYMSCSNCKKISNVNFEETCKCCFCKSEHAKAVPRANAFIRLKDHSGELDVSIIGEAAEALLEAKAKDIMDHFLKNSDTDLNEVVKTESKEDLLFYLKVTQKRQDPPEYRYEIVFALNGTDAGSSTQMDDINISTSGKGKEKMCTNQDPTNIAAEVTLTKRGVLEIGETKKKTKAAIHYKTNGDNTPNE